MLEHLNYYTPGAFCILTLKGVDQLNWEIQVASIAPYFQQDVL
jgi:hypothetical protein